MQQKEIQKARQVLIHRILVEKTDSANIKSDAYKLDIDK